MTEPVSSNPPPAPDLRPRRRWSPSLVWLIPAIAAVIAGYLAVHAVLSRGPTITIAFKSAEGLEAGKTKIKYKDVDVGEVTAITLSSDRKHIIATAQLSRDIEQYLVDDSRFWVVRPRIAGGTVSGLSTLLSGAYIGFDVGHSQQERLNFIGLDVPPIITGDQPGRQFKLFADDLGSLDVGAPIYYRRIAVGRVVGYKLDPSGHNVIVSVFVEAPYDKFVTQQTRFWNASGVDLKVDANGVKLNTQSIASIVLGGIAFETPESDEEMEQASPNTTFTLAHDHEQAMRTPDRIVRIVLFRFHQSLRGLSVGAPVDFRGIALGEVTRIGVEYNKDHHNLDMLVQAHIYPSRLRSLSRQSLVAQENDARLRRIAERGLHAQLRSANLLTGQLYVALDFFPGVQPAKLTERNGVLELPTMPGDLEELQATLKRIAARLDKVPLDTIGKQLQQNLTALNKALDETTGLMKQLNGQVAPEAQKTLQQLNQTLQSAQRTLSPDSPAQQDVRTAAQEVSKAAQSFRALSDYLERHPEALIRGKQGDKP
ncbi:MlaD family protein [Crenobacter sp. SG2303]|uniref:MlaD family protein n=1 Tax=Crenobacter oryzisoli TaxID=3056844 RepID=A0ABT7XK91_9NEIS|nr:MlaD family protein [Crenobacter sp. SG2303]MDN0074188.1 MlaD family protein [Crenobacter sp. SG2303]